MADKEWYTLQEIAAQYNIAYHKISTATRVLENLKLITIRENAQDNRVKEISKDSVETVVQGARATA